MCPSEREPITEFIYMCVYVCVQQRLPGFSKGKLFREMTFKNPTHLPLFLYINLIIISIAKI